MTMSDGDVAVHALESHEGWYYFLHKDKGEAPSPVTWRRERPGLKWHACWASGRALCGGRRGGKYIRLDEGTLAETSEDPSWKDRCQSCFYEALGPCGDGVVPTARMPCSGVSGPDNASGEGLVCKWDENHSGAHEAEREVGDGWYEYKWTEDHGSPTLVDSGHVGEHGSGQ